MPRRWFTTDSGNISTAPILTSATRTTIPTCAYRQLIIDEVKNEVISLGKEEEGWKQNTHTHTHTHSHPSLSSLRVLRAPEHGHSEPSGARKIRSVRLPEFLVVNASLSGLQCIGPVRDCRGLWTRSACFKCHPAATSRDHPSIPVQFIIYIHDGSHRIPSMLPILC